MKLATIVPSLTTFISLSSTKAEEKDFSGNNIENENTKDDVSKTNTANATTTKINSTAVINREMLDQSFKTFFRVIGQYFPPLVIRTII
jgi:hypothetical protein